MKHYLAILLCCICYFSLTIEVNASILPPTCDLIQEDLEGHSTNNPPTDWQINGGYIIAGGADLSNSGTTRAGLNSINDNIVLAPLTCPGELCFFWRASGSSSDYDVDIEWSQDDGASWNLLQRITTTGSGSPTAYAEVCLDLPEELYDTPSSPILLRFYHSRRSGGSFYFDDICVSSGACAAMPTQLTFQDVPTTCTATDTPFSVTVCATDGTGNIDASFAETISITKNSGNGDLVGTTSATATDGCAIFSDLSFNVADTYTLLATSASFTGQSDNIVIESTCTANPFDTLTVMSYNVLNFPNGSSCSDNITIPSRWDTLRKIVDYIQPDVLMVCELQNEVGADRILNDALNVDGMTAYQRADFVVNQSGANPNLNNMFFYRSDKMTLQEQSEVLTNVRDIGRYTVFLNDPNLASHQDTTHIDFYMAHLKAGNTSTDAQSRAEACGIFQTYLNNQTSPRNAILGGDFNLYTSNEDAYQLLTSGTYPFLDPINTPGSWDNNFDFRMTHTQSVRDFTDPMKLDCGATGGMDSRFDFILTTSAIMNGTQHVEYIPNTYQALGNNGDTFNDAINDPTNNSNVPQRVLEALYHMSDHLPVILKMEVDLPAPVTLATDELLLRGQQESQSIALSWQNNDNETVAYWIIEKSLDAKNFKSIAQLTTQESFFEDKNPVVGMNYFRLKSVSVQGKEKFSNIVPVHWKGVSLLITPNPAKDYIRLAKNIIDSPQTIHIYNVMGQQVGQFLINEQERSMFIGDLPSGVYYLKMEGEPEMGQFVKW